jgi:hypothetical protein
MEDRRNAWPRGIALCRGRTFSVPGMDRGVGVMCLKGLLWITRENDPGDYLLAAGSTWTCSGPGMVVVEAVHESEYQLLVPGHGFLQAGQLGEAL